MRYDYRVWIETVIQYRDEYGIIKSVIEGDKPQRKYNTIKGDPDFDLDCDRPYTLNDEIREYDRKIMFINGSWHCLPDGKMRIQRICYERKVPFDSIVQVFKFKNGYLTLFQKSVPKTS